MQNTGRLHSLNALRASALLLGIVLHGAMPYLQGIKGYYVCIDTPSDTLAAVVYIIHIFRMPVFFLIAGFFGHMVIERRGTKAFIKDRFKRILVPLLVGYPVVVILTVVAFILGHLAGGTDIQSNLKALQRGSGSMGFTWVHLWFLYYLLIFYVCVMGIRAVFNGALDRSGRIRRVLDTIVLFIMKSGWAPVILALPLIVYFYNIEGGASWLGFPPALKLKLALRTWVFVGYGIPFGLGWLLYRQTHLLLALKKRWLFYCAPAVILTCVCYTLAGSKPQLEVHLEGSELLIYTSVYMICIWCWIFGLIGISIRFLSKESAVRRYISDSSYWLYLMHIPVLVFLQVLFVTFDWHWSVKYLYMLGITIPILLLSYHCLVRFTFIGATLNGRRHPHVRLQTNDRGAA